MRRLAAVSASLLVAACASAPRTPNELVSARAAYRAAAATPQVQARAPVELQLAERALGEAERLQQARSEEHTSELQSLRHLVCRLLLEKKKKKKINDLSNSNKYT